MFCVVVAGLFCVVVAGLFCVVVAGWFCKGSGLLFTAALFAALN